MANDETENNDPGLADVLEMDSLERAMLEEQAAIQRLEERIAKFMTQAAMQEFPMLKNMNSAQIREFGSAVRNVASEFSLVASHLAYEAEKEG